MRKLIIPFFVFLFLAYSCANDSKLLDENLQQTYLSEKIENSITKKISAKYQNFIFLKGKFKVLKPTEKQLVFYTETEDFRHIFLVNEIDKSEIVKLNDVSSLSYLKNGLVINNNVFLEVIGNSNDILREDSKLLINKKSINNLLKSKNLIYYWIPKNNNENNNLTIDELIQNVKRIAPPYHDGGCQQGGEGSTSCSVTSNTGAGCSVSCGTGYYSCCNETPMGPNDCHCHKS